MFEDAVTFVGVVGSVVKSLIVNLGQIWDFIFYAFSVLLVLCVLKQVGYRNGD